jgi:hypothetical protein
MPIIVGASEERDDQRRRYYRITPLGTRALEREAQKVRDMGEVAYMRTAGREAREWISQHPGQFARLSAARMAHWWLGPLYQPSIAALVTLLTVLALVGTAAAFPSMSIPARWAVSIPLLLFPVVHYIVAYMPRYREPVDWILLVLAATAVRYVVGPRPEICAPAGTGSTGGPAPG